MGLPTSYGSAAVDWRFKAGGEMNAGRGVVQPSGWHELRSAQLGPSTMIRRRHRRSRTRPGGIK